MSSPCRRFFLYAAMRFLIESGTRADIFFVGNALAVAAVEIGSGTGGTRTWRWRLSLNQLSREAGVHQSVSAPARRVTSSEAGRRQGLNRSCLTPRQQHREDQNFEVTIEPQSTIELRRSWWGVSDCKNYKDFRKPRCIDCYLPRLVVYHSH